MAKYIKSHSNYVLSSKHQSINDGTIWQRDITTIGALNQFAPGQTPIYRSGNFIITARDDRRVTKQYNGSNWEKNPNGDVWTLETVKDMVSDYKTESDTKIVLKKDYYDFRDFAYYGSLTELFRASITDIINRFPGEMFFSADKVYYTKSSVVDGEVVTVPYELGEDGFVYEVKNPFGIDIYSPHRPQGANVLKYFADEGYLNYELLEPCEGETDGFTLQAITVCDECKNPGDRIDGCCGCENIDVELEENCNCGSISITLSEGRTRSASRKAPTRASGIQQIVIRLYKGNDGKIHYMHNGTLTGYHLRPKEEFLIDFYNESNDFERLILDFDTTPRYSSTFSVIRENDLGYYREFQDFTFPTSDGGYNPTTDEHFIDELVKIGEFYDERFTDNLYRSMTHEAIKNFDWTYTREYEDGDELEFIAGGQKVQKALRIFAREFDEIKSYIDNIRFMNRVTYDQRSNLPDYFLSDVCEQDGWDIKSVMPYDVELFKGETKYEWGGYPSDCSNGSIIEMLFNNEYRHEYTQDAKRVVTPYTKDNIKDGTENGYFMDCTTGTGIGCWVGALYGSKVRPANEQPKLPGSTPMSECNTNYENISVLERKDGTSRIQNRIKSYTDESEYTHMSVSNEFLRRLALNSRDIWRHKGTVEGMEMILGMFGLKSQRWLDKMNTNDVKRSGGNLVYQPSLRYEQADECNPQNCKVTADYEIIEYTSFAKRIEEEWDVENQMYRIDWVNTTKTIVYDNRSTSNYTRPGSVGRTIRPYQGILVAYRDEYKGYGDDRYMKYDGTPYLDERGNKVPKRYLYPSFNRTEENDGNPYFQMDGGWLAKKLTDGTNIYNFQFDVDDNIVHNKYVATGTVTENGFIDDNHPLYKETIRNIKRVETLNELVTIPQIELRDGIVCYVGRIGKDIAVINGEIFDITHQGENLRYITYMKKNGFISVGGMYFDENIMVYDRDGNESTYYINDKEDGYEIKAYIKSDDDFITYSMDNPSYTITSFQIISDEVEEDAENTYTNYFILDDIIYSDTIATPGERDGWRRLKANDYEYMRINTITNYYEGNNGHNGNMVYDSGHEYLTYFNRIFKYAYDNDLFDSRCYTDGFDWLGGEVFEYGFSGLVESNEEIKQYDRFLLTDEKIHYFGNYVNRPDPECTQMLLPAYKRNYDVKEVNMYGDWHRYASSKGEFKANTVKSMWLKNVDVDNYVITSVTTYNTNNLSKIGITDFNDVDDVTNQIVNNKRLKIIFNMKYCFNSKEGQNELKYIDDVVLNYLTQMVPSTAIFDVEYKYCNFNYNGC